MSGLGNEGNYHTMCVFSLVYILGEEGNYCVKILLLFILVCITAARAVDNLSHLMQTGIEFLILDQGLGNHIPLDFLG